MKKYLYTLGSIGGIYGLSAFVAFTKPNWITLPSFILLTLFWAWVVSQAILAWAGE